MIPMDHAFTLTTKRFPVNTLFIQRTSPVEASESFEVRRDRRARDGIRNHGDESFRPLFQDPAWGSAEKRRGETAFDFNNPFRSASIP